MKGSSIQIDEIQSPANQEPLSGASTEQVKKSSLLEALKQLHTIKEEAYKDTNANKEQGVTTILPEILPTQNNNSAQVQDMFQTIMAEV